MQGNVICMYALILSAQFPCVSCFHHKFVLFFFCKIHHLSPFYLILSLPYLPSILFLSICQLHILFCVHLIFNFPWSFIFIQPLIYYSSYILLFTRCCFSFNTIFILLFFYPSVIFITSLFLKSILQLLISNYLLVTTPWHNSV